MDKNQIHDLTMLYLDKSLNMSDFQNPSDYVAKYNEIFSAISSEANKNQQAPVFPSTDMEFDF
ncbi:MULTISPECIES: hypothetical protein [unclassified Clostridium]|uniref:hypothetical protein n=1 Tax=unclassified Clostridium TaxID=2614128 RepID=UPI00029757C9|nr:MULTISPECIES: hypothetical protein [unclassified Clostridium]EKQ56331.1 MAG: hypothetical protein A370_02087 [Clostridium sp. Maddingley MBC34-26]